MRPRSRKPVAPVAKLERQPSNNSQWGWVFTEVTVPDQITHEHRQAACGFAPRNALQKPLCSNKYFPYAKTPAVLTAKGKGKAKLDDYLSEDSIVEISDDDVTPAVPCSKKSCRTNPNCLNYLGQSKWNDKARARDSWLETSMLGEDPSERARDITSGKPIGLKNLGATCYANAFLQVWFQDLTFRTGVYRCLPASTLHEGDPGSSSGSNPPEDSPIYQLQVTFAALQNLKENVFNPVKLVESLHLKVSEQQDAQEFSKLFMTLLSEEFQRQRVASLKSLVSDQFEGTQVYGTRCKTCNYRSEREADFLELEVNLQNNSKLEDCVHRLLQSEILNGDNQYFCPNCNSLQDAVRYTELKQLPPVLHFSLLRFVYDVDTGSRKKSKHSIIFPAVLDMQAFVGEGPKGTSSETPQHPKAHDERRGSPDMYELRGILLHKGPSAYHGHYEAQVFDVTKQAWFEVNDEVVTPIDLSKSSAMKQTESGKENETASNGKRKKARRTTILSDDDDIDIPTSTSAMKGYLSSKDAYMLIYTRRKAGSDDSPRLVSSPDVSLLDPSLTTIAHAVTSSIPEPPLHAAREVDCLNAIFDQEVQRYEARKREILHDFERIREEKMSIYRMWHLSHHSESSIVVDSKVLEDWLAEGLVMPRIEVVTEKGGSAPPSPTSDGTPAIGSSSDGQANHMSSLRASSPPPSDASSKLYIPAVDPVTKESSPVPILTAAVLDNQYIICCHGQLDPAKFAHMKRINMAAYERIVQLGGRRLSSELLSGDVCIKCVEAIFSEKLYILEHPGKVEEFDQLNEMNNGAERSVFISRPWLRDWHLKTPKFHNSNPEYVGDPPPDAALWRSHVFCEHGGLSLNHTNRSRISGEAASLILDLFPAWQTINGTQAECQVCTQILADARHDHSALKRAADVEKAHLRDMRNPLDGPNFVSGVPFAGLPSHFIRAWRMWTNKPTQHGRPSIINNQPFICEHGLLIFDPKIPSDLKDPSICFIRWEHWKIFAQNYEINHPILIDVEGEDGETITADIETCQDCRSSRMSDFNQAVITLHIMDPSDPVPTSEIDEPAAQASQVGDANTVTSNGNPDPDMKPNAKKRATPNYFSAPTRKSKRIRQTKERAINKSLLLAKTDTVKDLKVKIHEELDIPTIYQKLYYRGRELTNNSVTVAALGILALDTIFLHPDKPLDEEVLFTSDHEHGSAVKDEGSYSAFSGTLLAGIGLNRGVSPKGGKQIKCEVPCSSPVQLGSPLSSVASDTAMEVDAAVEHPITVVRNGLPQPGPEIICSTCTFINPGDLSACAMCDGLLEV